ncbi:MAG: hypothetical protein AAFR61_11410 [Bacteroidota bacterium]
MHKLFAFLLLMIPFPMNKEFPFDNLKISEVYYEFTQETDEQDAEIELVVKFEPFMLEGEEVSPAFQFLGFSSPRMEQSVFSDGYHFSEEDGLEPSTIYFQSVHNPVDLKALRIEKQGEAEVISFDLFFDFEYEGTGYKSESRKFVFEKKP